MPTLSSRGAGSAGYSVRDYLKKIYGLKSDLVEVIVPEGSILRGHTFADIMVSHNLYIIGSYHRGQRFFTPVIDTVIEDPCRLAVLGRRKVIQKMAKGEKVSHESSDLSKREWNELMTSFGFSEKII